MPWSRSRATAEKQAGSKLSATARIRCSRSNRIRGSAIRSCFLSDSKDALVEINRGDAKKPRSKSTAATPRLIGNLGAVISSARNKSSWRILRCHLPSSIPTRAAAIFSNPSRRRICSRRFFRSHPSTAKNPSRVRSDCRGEACAKSNRNGISSSTKRIRTPRAAAAFSRFGASAESLVHRIRAVETIRRSLNRNALPIRRVALLASVPAKQAQRRCAHYRAGHFSQSHAQQFFPVRNAPTSDTSGVSAARPNSSEFFGRSEQLFFSNDFSIGVDLFKGETAFKPVVWALRLLAVANYNYITVKENNVLDPDPRGPGFTAPPGPLVNPTPGDPSSGWVPGSPARQRSRSTRATPRVTRIGTPSRKRSAKFTSAI